MLQRNSAISPIEHQAAFQGQPVTWKPSTSTTNTLLWDILDHSLVHVLKRRHIAPYNLTQPVLVAFPSAPTRLGIFSISCSHRGCTAATKGHPPTRLHVVLEAGRKVEVHEQGGQALPQRLASTRIIGEAQVAADDMLEQAHAWVVRQYLYHVVQHGTDGEEALGGCADVVQATL